MKRPAVLRVAPQVRSVDGDRLLVPALLGQEGATLRKTVLPTIYYVTVAGILGLIAIYVLELSDPLLEHVTAFLK